MIEYSNEKGVHGNADRRIVMKKITVLLCLILPMSVMAADVRDPRVGSTSIVSGLYGPAQNRRGTASKNQLTGPKVSLSVSNMSPSLRDEPILPVATTSPEPTPQPQPNRNAERDICLNNNIGVGTTFVWASRYSDTSSYASMREDTNNPENNVCFSRVDLKSTDPAIDLSDIPSRYFPWGNVVTCGSWVDESVLEKRIADAKKSGRALATTAAVLGGVGLGVGVMEGFGNRMIGGKLEGQKDKNLTKTDLMRSQLLVLKNESRSDYDRYIGYLKDFKEACEEVKKKDSSKVPSQCTDIDYETLLKV